MDALTQLWSPIVSHWQQWSLMERAGLIASSVVCLIFIGGAAWWAVQPEYVTLANRLPPADAAEIVSALEAAGIRYQLNFAGSAVLVPQQQLTEARLTIRDVAPGATSSDDNSLDNGLWADPAVTQVRLQRDQEQRIARSIAQVHGVRNATVHLTRPEYSPFVRDRGLPKASVVLDLQPGAPFTAADAHSLIALVAHSVEGLTPENVSIMDTNGRHLSAGSALNGDVAGRLEFQQNLESQLSAKAEAMLAQWLGPGNSVVRVTADIDFTETVREETSYDPASKVKRTEKIETTTETRQVPTFDNGAGNAAGTASNLGLVSGNPARSAVTSKTEKNETDYDNTRVVDRVTEAPGTIRRLTVAAVVYQPPSVDQSDDTAAAPAIDKAAVEAIVKQSVGFDVDRNDGIEVLVASRPAGPEDVVVEPAGWQRQLPLLREMSVGLVGVAALVCIWLVLRRLKPVIVEVPAVDGLSVEAAHRLSDVSQRAQRNPEAAAKVLAAWLQESAAADADASKRAA
ncbi:MAG: flagellar basal-body MS-ring/collar protein FliF [Planctomycetaceae bacterium]